jgi:hypothetical protein
MQLHANVLFDDCMCVPSSPYTCNLCCPAMFLICVISSQRFAIEGLASKVFLKSVGDLHAFTIFRFHLFFTGLASITTGTMNMIGEDLVVSIQQIMHDKSRPLIFKLAKKYDELVFKSRLPEL